MTASPDKGLTDPDPSQTGHTLPPNVAGIFQPKGIPVQCPNPACAKHHVVPASWAGKKGKCSCGTHILIPDGPASVTQPVHTPAPAPPKEEPATPHSHTDHTDGKTAHPEERAHHDAAAVKQVRVGCIGRGHAGKTALFRALSETLVGEFLPSGVHVDAGDPREVAQIIREAAETQRLLETAGLPPTLKTAPIHYYLFEGDKPRVVCRMREVIGQILTHTVPRSGAEQQQHYSGYLKSLLDTHVLWVMVPSQPPNPTVRDRKRYANDLRLATAYLREALRLRSAKHPVAVALVLSKVDTLFQDAEEARAILTDAVLMKGFGPIVNLIDKTPRVSDAVIIPITAFGFGNAVLRQQPVEPDGTAQRAPDEPFGEEPVWLLREGVGPQPYNLDTLFLWTVLFGLLNEVGHAEIEAETEIGEMCRTLREDLSAADPWLVTLKGGIEG
jgi:hypothetical protein